MDVGLTSYYFFLWLLTCTLGNGGSKHENDGNTRNKLCRLKLNNIDCHVINYVD